MMHDIFSNWVEKSSRFSNVTRLFEYYYLMNWLVKKKLF
jgi:hypothetical protein